MEFTSLNLVTSLIFIFFIILILYFLYNFYLNKKIINKNFYLISNWKYFYIKYVFLFISFFIVFISIFWLKSWEKKIKNESKWVDITFVLDVSKSMNVADIKDQDYIYTRLNIAKESISKFVTNHRQDRFWLIIFAWEAISTIPLTSDHDIFLTFLENVDYRNLTKQGSDFTKAISLWIERFSDSIDRSKVLIFISDWWDEDYKIEKNKILNISKQIKGINYFIVWIWTNKWWNIITWRDVFWRLNYQKYNWNYVISKLNTNNLNDLSDILNWEYLEVSTVLDILKLNKFIDSLEKKILLTDVNGEKADAGRLLTIMSFMFFILFLILYIFENNLYKLIWKKWVKN